MAQKTVTTKPTKNKWVKKMKYPVIIGATLLGGMGAYGAGLSGGGRSLLENIKLGTNSLFGNTQTATTVRPKVPGPFDYMSGDYSMGGTVTTSVGKKSGGIGGFFSSLLGGLFGGGGLSLGDILGGIGGFFSDKTEYELDDRRIKINEEQVKINRLKAEAEIDAEKRQTAIASTFMGHTNPIAAVEGVNVEPGLVVNPWKAPTEVRKQPGGAIGGSQQGMISQADQRKVV
jgi:hypothetical protein